MRLKSKTGEKDYPVTEMANSARRVLVPTDEAGFLCFEERSSHGVGIIPQVIRDLRVHVIRIYDNQELLLEGVVNGDFVDDVELSCTHIAWPTPAEFEQESRLIP